MQSIIANDQPAALSDAFRCLVKELHKAGVVRLADLAKANKALPLRRRFIASGLRR
jgi:hypothetical protein